MAFIPKYEPTPKYPSRIYDYGFIKGMVSKGFTLRQISKYVGCSASTATKISKSKDAPKELTDEQLKAIVSVVGVPRPGHKNRGRSKSPEEIFPKALVTYRPDQKEKVRRLTNAQMLSKFFQDALDSIE